MTVNSSRSISCIAPVNIAVIKYWGKRDTKLILPTNDSLSVTLSMDSMCSETKVSFQESSDQDVLVLNNEKSLITSRIKACLDELRRYRRILEAEQDEPKIADMHLKIESSNTFPTAAGLASSASGLACLVFSVAHFYELVEKLVLDYQQLSRIARLGSGSACRSIFGGYVKWNMGHLDDGSDSLAVQIAPREFWPDMRAVILVASARKKDVSSTAGMQTTVQTSALFQERIANVVPQRMKEIEAAIMQRDFARFAKITMQDSNQFHAVCLDSFPPIFYMNDVSKAMIQVITELNALFDEPIAAYTFDAGANGVVYVLERNLNTVASVLNHFFPVGDTTANATSEAKIIAQLEGCNLTPYNNAVKQVFIASVGDGPKIVDFTK